jgi:hypothetical protein
MYFYRKIHVFLAMSKLKLERLTIIAGDCRRRRIVNAVMYFSEIDLFPRSEGSGLSLALAKYCAILVFQTTMFCDQSPPASRPAAQCQTITDKKVSRYPT